MQLEKGIKLKSIIIKNKEYILYLIFGILTTLVNFFIYYLFTYILKANITAESHAKQLLIK